jgi:hypothetical protein
MTRSAVPPETSILPRIVVMSSVGVVPTAYDRSNATRCAEAGSADVNSKAVERAAAE